MKISKIIALICCIIAFGTVAYAQDDECIDFTQASESGDVLGETLSVKTIAAFEPLKLNSSEVVFKQAKRRVDIVDPSSSTSYPGGRGPNKLVIYTPSYGMHTGTNEFGTEAVVEDNIVTTMSGADSAIPEGGIVISGHGTAKNWISQNISVGSKVFVDMINSTITVYTTSESYTYDARTKIDEAVEITNYYKQIMKDYSPDIAYGHIKTAQNYLQMAKNSAKNIDLVKQYSQEAINSANMAIKTAIPYIKDEMRGVWVRPTEHTEEQIIATLNNLKENGFNAVFLETYYHGKTIFPSKTMNKYGFTVQNPQFADFDPLKIWVKEAHKRGIKVHTWFQSFYVGNSNPYSDSSSILALHPEWGNKTKNTAGNVGATKSSAEHNGYFLDPANPEVQDFLEELITEIITEYKPDGINLDYIRYPNSNPRNVGGAWGFTEYARNDFQAMYGVDPIDLTISDAAWYDWNVYRRNAITNFVQKIGTLGREHNTYISTVIFPDIASAISTKQQDWRNWSKNNYIDGFTPLFLTYDSKMLSSMMRDVMSVKAPETELYAGLFVTFMGGTSEDLVRQIFETRKMYSNGIILFDYAHTTPDYTSTLVAGAFNSNYQKDTRIAQKKNRLQKKKNNRSKKTKAKEKLS